MQAAWQRLRDVGSYRFASDLEQEIVPLPTLQNMGRSSEIQRMYVEGDANVAAERLELSVWSNGGTALDPASAARVKIENGQAYVKDGESSWRAADNFMGGFAPGNDLLGFLHAAKNIQPMAVADARAGAGTAYSFESDGPRYARYVRDQLQDALAKSGQLPNNRTVDVSLEYFGMTGSGELLVDSAGLPRHQKSPST